MQVKAAPALWALFTLVDIKGERCSVLSVLDIKYYITAFPNCQALVSSCFRFQSAGVVPSCIVHINIQHGEPE